jgi:hypothetical protein
MGSPAGCGCDSRQLHLNMIERSQPAGAAPGKHCGDASLADCRSGITRAATSPTNTSNAMGRQQRHDLRDYKDAKSALLHIRR